MSAHLAAKVSVSHDQQADPSRLAAIYDDMAAKFQRHGLTLPAVQAMRQYFTNLEGTGPPAPLDYEQFVPPLPENAVRLCVVFFQETNRRLMELVHEAAQEIMAALPAGARFHLNRPSHYHITVFMTSQPHTLRPDPFVPGGGLPVERGAEETAAAARPNPATLLQEVAEMRSLAASSAAPHLEVGRRRRRKGWLGRGLAQHGMRGCPEALSALPLADPAGIVAAHRQAAPGVAMDLDASVHRLLMADSGTLLLCSVDRSGNLARLRARLRASFPGAPSTQSSIMHASIGRILSTEQLTVAEIERVQAACDRWSEQLRGMQFDPEVLYHICERTFTTVEGPRIPLPFQQNGKLQSATR
ncbi:hypothetical protein N2152v2_005296 [Parachlorella kessleri]